jgi:hypothetical protein
VRAFTKQMEEPRPTTVAKARLEIAMAVSIFRTERTRTSNRAGLQMRCLHRLDRTRRALRAGPIWYSELEREIDEAVSEVAGDRTDARHAIAG